MKPTGMKSKSRSARAGLTLPISRIHRMMKAGRYAPKIGLSGAIFLAGAVEYVVSEILELSAKAAEQNKKHRVMPRYIQLAIRNDDELDALLKGGVISHGGVLPQIQQALLPKKTMKKQETQSQEYE